MTYREILPTILTRAETEDMLFDWDEVMEWPEDALELFLGLKMLRPASPASTMNCSDCERECVGIPALVVELPNGKRKAYLLCPEYGRIEIPFERLNRWQVDLEGLARWLAGELATNSGPEEILPRRLWLIGRPEVGRARTDVILARGLGWPDCDRLWRAARNRKRSQTAVMLVPAVREQTNAADDCFTICSLDGALSLSAEGLEIDPGAIQEGVVRVQQTLADASVGRLEGHRFMRDGQRWSVTYDGKHISLNHSDGATYIAYMLEHPSTPLHVRALYAIAHPQTREHHTNPYTDMSSEELADEDLFLDNGRSPTDKRDDAELFATYRESRDDLQRELEEARRSGDSRDADELQAKLDGLNRVMSAEFGLDGSPRQPGDPNKQAYDRVSKAIKRVMKVLQKEHRGLTVHLENSLSFDTYFYCYRPDRDIPWET